MDGNIKSISSAPKPVLNGIEVGPCIGGGPAISQSARPAKGLQVSPCEAPSKSHFQFPRGVLPVVGNSINPAELKG
jgi:hypothetical protein